jgi:tRNA A-37 threonylcarbamoyl transferase component Bud32
MEGKNLCNPHDFMRHRRNNGSIHKGIMVLKKNVAWMGCPNKECKHEIAIKQCDQHEYNVQRFMEKAFPGCVPKVYGGTLCGNGKFYMYSDFIRNGTVKKRKNYPQIGIVVQKVFLLLKRIHEKYPDFRHNDLHTDNVLVDGDKPMIYDFGYANWRGNPIFDETLKKDYGIYPGNHKMYDFHFFANSVYSDLPKHMKEKVMSVFPSEYLGDSSPVIKNGRLRWDANHSGLPSMDQVIKAFSPRNNKMRPKLMTFTGGTEKKTKVNRSPPKKMSPRVKFSLTNKRRASDRKAELVRQGMNEIQAELKAIKNIEKLKLAGLLTPSPSPAPIGARKRAAAILAVATSSSSGPSRPAPVLTYTNTPRYRPRINRKLCTSYKKDELVNVMRRMGHRVNKRMTTKDMCKKLIKPRPVASVYIRPLSEPIINARKITYPKILKKNLSSLAKSVGIPVKSKDKKGDIVNKIYSKLNSNVAKVLSVTNKKTVTARQIAETLAKNYNWKNNRHVERVRLLKIYRNKM